MYRLFLDNAKVVWTHWYEVQQDRP